MAEPLAPAQVAALREELGRIQAYLSVVPPAQAGHPSVARARERAAAIDAALAASERRAAKLTKKMRKLLPQLIEQVGAVNPVVASQMRAALSGEASARDALMAFAAQAGAAQFPQLAPVLPMVAALLDDEQED